MTLHGFIPGEGLTNLLVEEKPVVRDENGTLILIGSLVECGEGEPGVVVDITEPDECHGKVYVKWPEWDDPEGFIYHGTGWCWEGPDVCDEVRVVLP